MSAPDLLLPEGAVLLHIGPRKTGTSTIQAGLTAARGQLAEHGADYPPVQRHPQRVAYDRARAASPSWAVVGVAPPGFEVPDISVWEEFARTVRERTARGLRVCVSSETFGSTRNRAKLDRIVADLGGDNVHVLATSRALYRVLPSHWQQQVKVTVDERDYEAWLRVVFGEDDRAAGRAFWHAQDVGMAMRAWSRAVGPGKFTLIVTDDTDRSLLPDTVAALLGIPVGLLDAGSPNKSLTLAETEVLRRLNQLAREEHWSEATFTTLQRGIIRGLRTVDASVEAPRSPRLPSWAVPLVLERSRAQREEIERLGVRVIGDPDCLVPDEAVLHGVEDSRDGTVPVATAASAVGGTMKAAYVLDRRRRGELEQMRRSYDDVVANRIRRARLRELLTELAKRPLRRLLGRAEAPTDWAAHAPTPPPVEVADPIPGREDDPAP